MEDIRIEEVRESSAEHVEVIRTLLQQLSSSPVDFSLQQLEQIVQNEASRLFFILFENRVAGMLTLGTYYTPTGPKLWVEDVVVDQQYRGHSLGKLLVNHAIAEARKCQGAQLMLTSKPARVAANALYQAVGFARKETNVYRMTFDD